MGLKAHFLAAFAGLSMGILVGSLVVTPALGFGPPPPCPAEDRDPCPVPAPARPCRAAPDGTCPDTGPCNQDPYCICQQARGGGCDCCHPVDP